MAASKALEGVGRARQLAPCRSAPRSNLAAGGRRPDLRFRLWRPRSAAREAQPLRHLRHASSNPRLSASAGLYAPPPMASRRRLLEPRRRRLWRPQRLSRRGFHRRSHRRPQPHRLRRALPAARPRRAGRLAGLWQRLADAPAGRVAWGLHPSLTYTYNRTSSSIAYYNSDRHRLRLGVKRKF